MTSNDSERAMALHQSSIVIDGLTFYYDGASERLNPEQLTAMNVTACETYSGFTAAVKEIICTVDDDLDGTR